MKKPNSSTLKAWGQDPGHYLGGDGDGSGGDDEVDKEMEEAEAVDNLLKNRDVEKIAFQAHSMIHLNIYGLLIANHIIGIIKTSIDYRWLW